MRRKNTLAIVAISLGVALLAAAPASATTPNPAPGLNYSMNNTLNGLPGNPALTAAPACSNPGVEDICNTSTNFGSDSYGHFFHWITTQGNGGGLNLTTTSRLGNSYSLSLKFAVTGFSNDENMNGDPNNGFSKLIDFWNLTDDIGLYFNNADPHRVALGDTLLTESVPSGHVVTMTLVRDASTATPTVTLWIKDETAGTNAVKVIDAMDDADGHFVASDSGSGSILHLFQDEPETATNGDSHEGVQEARLYGFQAWPGVALQNAPGGSSSNSGTPLANTGSNDASLALTGLVLAALGSLLIAVRRRFA
jgi:LPXTG-motif cell wall-anchored protein